jgi:hypothetical protein
MVVVVVLLMLMLMLMHSCQVQAASVRCSWLGLGVRRLEGVRPPTAHALGTPDAAALAATRHPGTC